jgi:creatinine amidohydrolase
MRIVDMNWMQVEEHVKSDDRCVIPVGSVEQHAYLSLGVDMILSERVSVEAAEPLRVPVFPVLSYGITPYFKAFPGTVSLRQETALAVARDVLDSVRRAGFRKVLMVNGHGGNNPIGAFAQEWVSENPEMAVKWHNWWNAPRTWAKVKEIDPLASHASWMENLPWTRLADVAMPTERKPMIDIEKYMRVDPAQKKLLIGDGNFGGMYQRPDEELMAMWDVAVDETRALIEGGWD